jgi:hypothetical protein
VTFDVRGKEAAVRVRAAIGSNRPNDDAQALINSSRNQYSEANGPEAERRRRLHRCRAAIYNGALLVASLRLYVKRQKSQKNLPRKIVNGEIVLNPSRLTVRERRPGQCYVSPRPIRCSAERQA